MTRHSKLKYILLLSIFYFLFSGSFAQGAEIFFGTNSKEIGINEKFEIGVFINTEQESINTVGGKIVFPEDLLEFQGVYNGSSIISLWVKQPNVALNGNVAFSGIVPGGFNGNSGYLFSLIFKAKKIGEITIASSDENILLNDGTGKKTSVNSAPLTLNIIEEKSPEEFVPLYDPNPPEFFKLQVAKDENIFSGKWFLVFNTQDKESGIDHYEVVEKAQPNSIFSLPFLMEEQWIRGESPYLLRDQKLRSVILVRAFDRAGNVAIAALPARSELNWYENFWFWIIITIISVFLAIAFIIRKTLWKK